MPTPITPDITIDEYVSQPTGTVFEVSPDGSFHNSEMMEDEEVFDYQKYKENSGVLKRVPTQNSALLTGEATRCLDMPIRLAGGTSYALPQEWSHLQPLLEDIITVEHHHNPNWIDYHAYLTVDSGEVTARQQQRHGGLHVDGFQGERINPKTKINRSYVITTNGGTKFHGRAFQVLDPARFNVFQGFDLQAGVPYISQENALYFMNAYMVHESGFASRDGMRTFLRLSFDTKIFDRLGNTHNSMLDYQWDMVERDTQNTVKTPTKADLVNPANLL